MSRTIGRRRYLTNFEHHRLPHLFTDVLVVGAGVAGLRAALAAADSSDVVLMAKGPLSLSATSWAQGGVAAVVSSDDSLENHVADTLRVGGGLCDPDVVQRVVRGGPTAIDELCQAGANFDRDERGAFATGREGAHSHARIIHANGDATGREIVRVLLARVRDHPRIRLFENCFAIDLLSHDGAIVGCVTFHEKYGHQMFWANATILANGGYGRLYRESTNPGVSTGDGVAMAFRAGAVLRDMELVQFHPTTLYVAGAARALISEAVRGEGGRLVHRDGRRFMPDHDERAELAPRDIVSRAIQSEMKAQRVSNVFLDVRHLPPGVFQRRFPTIAGLCADFDLNPESDLIPVRPSAHYTIGGIAVATDGATSLPGLYACGEVANSGLHGANRLASNSLLEGLVLGETTGSSAGTRAQSSDRPDHPMRVSHLLPQSSRTALDLADIQHSLLSVMWRNVAIERSGDRLRETIEIIEFWSRYVMDKVFDEVDAWQTQNMLTVALAVATGAATRAESRGVHYRSDFPHRNDDDWCAHVEQTRGEDGTQVWTAPCPAPPSPEVAS